MVAFAFNNGDYRVVKKLGVGAFGEIFEVTRLTDNKQVALKVVNITDERKKRMYLKECDISLKLAAQRNVIETEHCYFSNQFGVLVMEKMDCDLLEYILEYPIVEHTAKAIFREICSSLYQCHNNAICHLDIKPENVLLKFSRDLRGISSIKLTDFGFAVDFSHDSTSLELENRPNSQLSNPPASPRDKLTHIAEQPLHHSSNNYHHYSRNHHHHHQHDHHRFQYNRVVGTKQYQPPEMSLCPASYAADKVDMWGLGIILFCMVTKSFPFAFVDGETVRNDFNLIRMNTKDDQCHHLILNLLNPNPALRYNINQVLSHPWLK